MSVNEVSKKLKIRWLLMAYDIAIFLIVVAFMVSAYGVHAEDVVEFWEAVFATLACLLFCRIMGNVYHMVIRYGGVGVYMRLFATDLTALLFYFPLKYVFGLRNMESKTWLIVIMLNLLCAVGIRLMYRYCYRYGVRRDKKGEFLRWLLVLCAGETVIKERRNENKRIRVAVLGAGRLGAVLADELLSNDSAAYVPVCFIDQDPNKAGREIMGLPILAEGEDTLDDLKEMGVQEIVFAITNIVNTNKEMLFNFYRKAGYKVKVYDFSVADVAKRGKRMLREFDIDELLFRQPIVVNNEFIADYYKGKVILVTGGGGSIGSELCRQLAKMQPKQIVALDIYENGVYDLQQELRLRYGDELDFKAEIANICCERSMRRIMEEYHPQIVVHAAAHKHVPLMEKNCIEAVENNVFGTLNVIKLCEEYGAQRFMMVSTDKAVNPTNIMGATKRMCEIIARAHSASGSSVVFSDTRFGNVLGSAGSVIPLFKRQIANGGPITLTDKRIIRYFMTIPEASQLVLHSGAIAKNGELFVLDMGQPIKIYDLAVNMIKLSGLEPHTFDNGALKFLGKANVNVFASRLEGNRVASSGSALEKDHAAFVGVRVDIMPTDAFTIGLERMSMLKKFNKHWLLGDNADDAEKDNWNDIAGLDFKYRFPGVQVYASLYGEDQAHAFPCENAYNVGMYFPQLVPDGSWDLRVEAAKTNDAWYGHWVLKNGWTYKDAILGDWLGADAKRVYAEVNHYLADGGKLGLSYTWADMQPTAQHDGRLQEVELSYSKSLQKDLLLHTAVGYGKLGDDTSKLVAVGLSWEY